MIIIEAFCAAPPEALPHSPSQMPLSCPVAPDRPELIELQATKPSPTPTRAEEDIATTPGCGPAVDSGHRAFATPSRTEEHIATAPGCGPAGRRAFAHADTPNTSPGCRPRRAAEVNFARRRAPLDHPDARGGAPYRDAGLQTSRPQRLLAHADALGGIPRRDAGLQTSRSRRQSAR